MHKCANNMEILFFENSENMWEMTNLEQSPDTKATCHCYIDGDVFLGL